MTTTAATTTAADRPLLTSPFLGWLSAAAAAAVGDGVLYFALGWVASGYGAHTAGWVLSLVLVPRTLLMLAGGALGDRWGLRTTLVRTQAATLAVVAFRDEERGCAGSRAVEARPGAYVELHIEQGPRLANAGAPLGIVTSIVGYARGRRVVEGRAGHAGTTPMDARGCSISTDTTG